MFLCLVDDCSSYRVDAKSFALVIDFISRLPLAKLVYLVYWWSGETTVKSAADTTGVSQKTIVQLYQYMRDVCSTKLLNTPPDLGGPGVVVQIDESLFNHKSKYQRGRRPDKKTWVFVLWVWTPVDGSTKLTEWLTVSNPFWDSKPELLSDIACLQKGLDCLML
jgi:hypothetical protein